MIDETAAGLAALTNAVTELKTSVIEQTKATERRIINLESSVFGANGRNGLQGKSIRFDERLTDIERHGAEHNYKWLIWVSSGITIVAAVAALGLLLLILDKMGVG